MLFDRFLGGSVPRLEDDTGVSRGAHAMVGLVCEDRPGYAERESVTTELVVRVLVSTKVTHRREDAGHAGAVLPPSELPAAKR